MLVNALGNDLAQDDTILLLRRIVKLLESNATVDSANRQRIVVDSPIVAGAAAIGSVTLGAGASAIGSVTLGAGAAAIGTVAVSTNAGLDHRQFVDTARIAYNTLRSNLIFS